MITGGADHTIRLWDLETGLGTRTLTSDKVVNAIDIQRTSGLLASGHTDKVIKVWDTRTTGEDGTRFLA